MTHAGKLDAWEVAIIFQSLDFMLRKKSLDSCTAINIPVKLKTRCF